TTGALEAAYAQAYGKNISLSEQQLVDCAGNFNNFGCNGVLISLSIPEDINKVFYWELNAGVEFSE
ncbi:hypothetical protein PIB30_097663, partial [Stylosanthes scabra]|nr:hypothetical protein [Stylosanthes scabra]